jgi:hypothetical protein
MRAKDTLCAVVRSAAKRSDKPIGAKLIHILPKFNCADVNNFSVIHIGVETMFKLENSLDRCICFHVDRYSQSRKLMLWLSAVARLWAYVQVNEP